MIKAEVIQHFGSKQVLVEAVDIHWNLISKLPD